MCHFNDATKVNWLCTGWEITTKDFIAQYFNEVEIIDRPVLSPVYRSTELRYSSALKG